PVFMAFQTEIEDKLFSVNVNSFEELCLAVFDFQARKVPVYREYLAYLKIKPAEVKKVSEIPFLPISLFKRHKIIAEGALENLVFESSGTTGMERSYHYVANRHLYHRSIYEGFKLFFGPPEEWTFLALLPTPHQKPKSSLVY